MSNWQKPPLGAQLNLNHRIARGLRGFWLINEGSGTTIVSDHSGNSHHGVFGAGDPTWATSQQGPCTYHVGGITNENITVGDIECSAYTFAIWVQPSATISAGIIDQLEAFQIDNYIWAGVVFGPFTSGLTNEVVAAGWTDGSRTGWEDGSASLAAETPHLIVFSWDEINSVYQIYVNGEAVPTTHDGTNGAVPLLNASAVLIGDSSGNNGFEGKILSAAIWDRSLSAEEIKEFYIDPYGMFEIEQDFALLASATQGPSASGDTYIKDNAGTLEFWGNGELTMSFQGDGGGGDNYITFSSTTDRLQIVVDDTVVRSYE